jgi:hypothetical protein
LGLFSPNAADLYAKATTGSEQKIWLPASDDVDQYYKYYRHQTALGRINELQQTFLNELERTNAVKTSFNTNLFFNADSRNPDSAGIRGALIGSFWTMLVTFLVAFPLGVLAAVYLEEFAKKGRLAAFLEPYRRWCMDCWGCFCSYRFLASLDPQPWWAGWCWLS